MEPQLEAFIARKFLSPLRRFFASTGPKCAHSSTGFGAKLALSRIGAGFKGILSSNPLVCSKLDGNLGEPPEDSECLEFPLFLRQATSVYWPGGGRPRKSPGTRSAHFVT